MRAILALGLKDLRILFRIKSAWFFTLIWPLLTAIVFGLIFGGGPRDMRISIALVDEDQSADSQAFTAQLAGRKGIDALRTSSRSEALEHLRLGRRAAAVILPKGFGEARSRTFFGTPPRIELAFDPSRQAEVAMLEGLLFEQAGRAMQELISNPTRSREMAQRALQELQASDSADSAERQALKRFLGEMSQFMAQRQEPAARGAPSAGADDGWKPLEVIRQDVARNDRRPRTGFDLTFVQGMLWGVISCVISFAVSLVAERTRGTFVRLQMAPLTAGQLLAGKALACFSSLLGMQLLVLLTGVLLFGLQVDSLGLLALGMLSTALSFTGIMMLVASLARSEEATAGMGWAIMMPMALLGGAMIPLAVMPPWMASASHISPLKWATLALEGGIWRGFTAADMLLPCAVLLGVGHCCFGLGVRALSR